LTLHDTKNIRTSDKITFLCYL